jgi:hypothetical protein
MFETQSLSSNCQCKIASFAVAGTGCVLLLLLLLLPGSHLESVLSEVRAAACSDSSLVPGTPVWVKVRTQPAARGLPCTALLPL